MPKGSDRSPAAMSMRLATAQPTHPRDRRHHPPHKWPCVRTARMLRLARASPTTETGAMSKAHVPVLIVGGGPTGLSASLLLSRHGVRSLLADRHFGTSVHPKGL